MNRERRFLGSFGEGFVVGLLCFVFFLAGWFLSPPDRLSLLVTRPNEIAGPLKRVIDGDTLELDGYRVRLWGVDAPRGNAARDRAGEVLADLGADRRAVCRVIEWQEATARYAEARAVARCFVDGRDVAFALLDAGVVTENRRYSKGFYSAGGE